ncbi:MAG: von Willebrand factor type [Myxococcales bacterium]|nr:von Willebrand factor type [Myxococcales bacterium]
MTAPVLELEAKLDVSAIPPGIVSELRCYLKVRATQELLPAKRSLVTNLCLVFDGSGSMAGEKCEAAIAAAERIVDTLDERHRISLVVFASSSRVLVDNAQATAAGRDVLKAKIAKLRDFVGGNTSLGSGIRSGADIVQRFVADAKVLVLLSDGAADDPKDALAHAVRATELGIQLFAVGIGNDYEADQLMKLVTPSNGAVFGQSDLDKLATTFGDLIARIETFIATNAQLVVTLGDGVRAGPLYKTRPRQAFVGDLTAAALRQVEIRVGNVERAQTTAFLLSLVVQPNAVEVARATLTFDVPALGLRDQTQQIALSVGTSHYAREADAEISGVYRRAQIARVVDELADAQRRDAKEESIEHVELLIRLAEEQGDERMRASYQQLRDSIEHGRTIAQDKINEVVIASTEQIAATAEKSGAVKQLYDVVLVAPGDSPILLLRALRELTGKPLRELNDLIARTPVALREALPLKDAKMLVEQIDAVGTGAGLKVRAR